MAVVAPYRASSKRALLLHDSLAFVALLAISIALFGVTLGLHRSFEEHRQELAVRWSARGRAALKANRPEEAVAALRSALSYAPDERGDQLLLAEALARAGHKEEATNYFLTLWDARPGDGFINLQLARLARERGDVADAEDYYRASIYGSWEGDATIRRREDRFELVDFLISQHQNAEARNELFTIAGNAPGDPDTEQHVAEKLDAAGYLPDALTFYLRSAAASHHPRVGLELAGEAAYRLGDYPSAEHSLDRALDLKADPPESAARQAELAALRDDARRIQQLSLKRDQPALVRADHIIAAAAIAQNRLRSCIARVGSTPSDAATISELSARWTAASAGPRASRRVLLRDAAAQDTWTQLVFLTEEETARVCGPPTGDDALLLRLASNAGGGSAVSSTAAPSGREFVASGK